MKDVPAKDIERLEHALKQVYHEGGTAPEPSQKWQQTVMREVRNIASPDQNGQTLPLILKDLCWPAVQLVFAMILMIGIYLINDASLTNLDMSLFYAEMQPSGENYISYYSF
ncbi:MAG: hypothetical protein QNJ17_05475 [Desulfocapsaceae bacterium]|nr:hypothetical protein [Desulfocapsaceae bacterium]